MKRSTGILLAAVAVVLIVAVAASAGEDIIAKSQAKLGLADAQATELRAEFTRLQPLSNRVVTLKRKLQALGTASSPGQRAMDAKRAELKAAKQHTREQYAAAMRQVLTAEQWAKYEAMQHEAKKSAQSNKY